MTMTKTKLSREYFRWLCRLSGAGPSYRKLMERLHGTDFSYTLGMDANRAEDGVNLRYRFGGEYGYYDFVIAAELDLRPCSVLEAMAALALRCEEHIMADAKAGDRTGRWFGDMLESLGLTSMRGEDFDGPYTDEVLDRFMRRKYKRNGAGGLFTVDGRMLDMRSIEIWRQMFLYLDGIP
jgi:hypothetical protein